MASMGKNAAGEIEKTGLWVPFSFWNTAKFPYREPSMSLFWYSGAKVRRVHLTAAFFTEGILLAGGFRFSRAGFTLLFARRWSLNSKGGIDFGIDHVRGLASREAARKPIAVLGVSYFEKPTFYLWVAK